MGIPGNKTSFGTEVTITRSGEVGIITGFAMHLRHKQKRFYVEYASADGRATANWFFEDELTT